MGWVRDYRESGSADVDRGDHNIVYLVDGGYTAAQITRDPTLVFGGETGSEPLPGYGSQHPENPAYKLDRYDVDADGNTARVTGIYSTDGARKTSVFEQPKKIGDYRWSFKPEQIEFSMPYQIRVREQFPIPPNFIGPPDPNDPPGFYTNMVWKQTDSNQNPLNYKWQQSILKYSIDVLIPKNQFVTAGRNINAQANKLHWIDNRYWQFIPDECTWDSTAKAYKTTYTYWNDPGFNFPSAYPVPPNVMIATPSIGYLRYVGVAMTRPPFHRVVLDNNQDNNPELPGVFNVIPIADVDDDGWQSLPGYIGAF